MKVDRIYEPKKEHRDWYFVEYHPANHFKFANVQLVLLIEDVQEADLVLAMENEAEYWLRLYPIPIMVSVFDNQDRVYKLPGSEKKIYLTVFFDESNKIQFRWGLLKDEEIPDTALDQKYRESLYSSFTYKTYSQLDKERKKRRERIEDGRFLILVWISITLFITEIIIYFNEYLSLIVFLFVLGKAIQKIFQFANIWPISKKEKELEQGLKDHYYYHCQMNPEGFKRLMLENLEEMRKKEIKMEAKSLEK